MANRWMITGGCGFIGCNLVRQLLTKTDAQIRVLDNLSVGSRDDLSRVCTFSEGDDQTQRVHFIEGDILDTDIATNAAKDIDVIVHLAANTGVPKSVENPRLDCEANVMGVMNILEAARANKVKRFVFASSGAPAGEVEPPIHEEMVPHPVSPYGASKLAGEAYCSAYYRTFGIETVALRFGNVYGPLAGRKESVVAKFVKLARAGETLEIYGDGAQTRDYIFVEDLVDAILKGASVEQAAGELFQIATSRETNLNELVEQLQAVLSDHGYKDIPVIHGEKRLGDVLRNYSDTSKAKSVLGWQATTELKDGLQTTVKWFLENQV